jgi:transmembrane sensor
MNNERLTYLFYQHFDGTATPEEKLELADLLVKDRNQGAIQSLMDEAWESFTSSRKVFTEQQSRDILQKVQAVNAKEGNIRKLYGNSSIRFEIGSRIAVAVIFLVVVGSGIFFFTKSRNTKTETAYAKKNSVKDIVPGGHKALLTLFDGSVISLDHAADGELTTQDGTKVIKVGAGQLHYETTSEIESATIRYNTLETPRGGQYSLVLPDGSKVWLNAASSIRYPTVFRPGSRTVEISGEVYFEVNTVFNKDNLGKKAASKVPFIVKTHGMEVEVLGTHFNINAYNDEGKIRTTLLEGAVKVHKGSKVSLLKPGQQATVLQKSSAIQVEEVEAASQAVAWKNGYFQFNQAGLPEVMRQLTKWYDVEIRYEGAIPDRQFSGEIPRNASLSEVLEILELSKVHVDLEGKEIVVKP